jgi:hypothetical protein
MTNDPEKQLDAAIGEIIAAGAAKPMALRPVPPKPVSLADQWDQKEKIEQQLRHRIRRERGMIIAEHDRLWAETKSDYERRIDDAVMGLELQRNQALETLRGQTAEKLRENDLLAQRMDRSLL